MYTINQEGVYRQHDGGLSRVIDIQTESIAAHDFHTWASDGNNAVIEQEFNGLTGDLEKTKTYAINRLGQVIDSVAFSKLADTPMYEVQKFSRKAYLARCFLENRQDVDYTMLQAEATEKGEGLQSLCERIRDLADLDDQLTGYSSGFRRKVRDQIFACQTLEEICVIYFSAIDQYKAVMSGIQL